MRWLCALSNDIVILGVADYFGRIEVTLEDPLRSRGGSKEKCDHV